MSLDEPAQEPHARRAWGYGLATVAGDGTVLDTWYADPRLGPVPAGRDRWIIPSELEEHLGADARRDVTVTAVTTEIDLDQAPETVPDAYLRLHLLSHLLAAPNTINLDDIYEVIPRVAWTTAGPMLPATAQARMAGLRRDNISLTALDHYPRLTDYVIPTDVRIADASRVRLGAYLSPGTSVMHEGFVNANAGTLGPALVEGRISFGVTVGAHSQIGGGASIMTTVAGGTAAPISLGERTLLGANSGIGISVGDDTVVEAGLYITAGTKVSIARAGSGADPREDYVKAATLSGWPGLLFRRNSLTGAVEVLQRDGSYLADAALPSH